MNVFKFLLSNVAVFALCSCGGFNPESLESYIAPVKLAPAPVISHVAEKFVELSKSDRWPEDRMRVTNAIEAHSFGAILLHGLSGVDVAVRLILLQEKHNRTIFDIKFDKLRSDIEKLGQSKAVLRERLHAMISRRPNSYFTVYDIEKLEDVQYLAQVFFEERVLGILVASSDIQSGIRSLDQNLVKADIPLKHFAIRELERLVTSYVEFHGIKSDLGKSVDLMLKLSRVFLPTAVGVKHYFELADAWMSMRQDPLLVKDLISLIARRAGVNEKAIRERMKTHKFRITSLDTIDKNPLPFGIGGWTPSQRSEMLRVLRKAGFAKVGFSEQAVERPENAFLISWDVDDFIVSQAVLSRLANRGIVVGDTIDIEIDQYPFRIEVRQ